jgi:hypothetical protein
MSCAHSSSKDGERKQLTLNVVLSVFGGVENT